MTAPAPLPAWEETVEESAAWGRDWFDRDDDTNPSED